MKFKEWLKARGLDHDNLDEATLKIMRGIHEDYLAVRSAAVGGGDDKVADTVNRAKTINGIARAVTETADAEVALGITRYANDLITDEGIDLSDVAGLFTEKLVELNKERGLTSEPSTSGDQVPAAGTVAVVGGSQASIRRGDVIDIYKNSRSRTDYKLAAKTVQSIATADGEGALRALSDELKDGTGQLRVQDKNSTGIRTITSASNNVMVQNLMNNVMELQMETSPDVSEQLVTVMPSNSKEDTWPEIEAENGVRFVKEGQEYPIMGAGGRSVSLGFKKYGAAISETKENSIFDKLGTVSTMLTSAARQLRNTRADLRFARVLDSTTLDGKHINFPGSSDGANAFYTTTEDARGNKNLITGNALVDTTDISAARQLLWSMTLKDGSILRPVMRQILVPSTLYELAWQLVNSIYKPVLATNDAQNTQLNIYGPNGPEDVVSPVVLSDPRIDTFSTTSWFAGDFQRQFFEKEVWAPEVTPRMDGVDPMRDITGLWIASACTEDVALSNMFVVKSEA